MFKVYDKVRVIDPDNFYHGREAVVVRVWHTYLPPEAALRQIMLIRVRVGNVHFTLKQEKVAPC